MRICYLGLKIHFFSEIGLDSVHDIDLPPHLAPLVLNEWGIWRSFVLRGPGFPAAGVERLAEPACSRSADTFISVDTAIEDQFRVAIRTLNAAIDRLAAAGATRKEQAFRAVLAARRRLDKRIIPQAAELDVEFGPLLRSLESLWSKRQQLQAKFESTFATCVEHQSQILKGLAMDPRFQEAMIWQNRHAFETGIRAIAEASGHLARNQSLRQREELIANYAQRYCVKNDTIGFFGPVAWCRIDSGEDLLDVVPGPSLLKSRHTYFESWALDRLAITLSRIEGMDWWIPPRLAPHISIEGGRMSSPGAQDVILDAVEAAVLSLCDGKHLLGEILTLIQDFPESRNFTQDQLHRLLQAKAAQGILVWRWLLPVEVNAERNLRRQLLRIEDAELRNRAIGPLDELEHARKKVEDSAGSPQLLNVALKELEEVFENITQTSGHRNPGKTYGSRAIVYEDCRRDLIARIDPELLAPAVPALALLLRGFRWLVHSMTQEFNRLFHQAYDELAAELDRADLPLMDWWIYTEPRLIDAPTLAEVENIYKKKWAEVLPISGDQSFLQFESRALEQRVQQTFPDIIGVHCPFRYYCPDMLLAATPEGIAKGEVLYVLGEVHLGKNTLLHNALTDQHPEPEELRHALECEAASGSLKIIHTNEVETTSVRTIEGVFPSKDYMLATTPNSVAPCGFETHPISELILRRQGQELLVVSKTGPRRFSIMEAFADIFCSFVVNKASWSRPARHVPRVQIDRLVVHRETWRARADELAFALEKEPVERFLGARRWMCGRGVTRRMFVKSPLEMKPVYVDMESPILVEILCRMARKVNDSGKTESELVFSEMLPNIDETWLRDAQGARYTCELRFAIVDLGVQSS